MAELKLVVFDVDGTLIDSIAHIETVMDQAFDLHGLARPELGAVRNLIGISLVSLLDQLHPGLDDAKLMGLANSYKDLFSTSSTSLPFTETAPLFPGAQAALDRLKAQDHILLGVATGKSRRGLNRLFDAHALDGFFQTTHVADDHPSKPHPAMLEATLRDTGIEPANAVMIGDTTYDLQMARSAGVTAIGVSWGNHPVETLRPHADILLEDFAALNDALDNLWSTS